MATDDIAWLDPALQPQEPVKMETVNNDKVPPPDYSQVLDPNKLFELWVVSLRSPTSSLDLCTDAISGLPELGTEPCRRHERCPVPLRRYHFLGP